MARQSFKADALSAPTAPHDSAVPHLHPVGKLPDGWSTARIGDVLRLINGAAFKPSDWTETGPPIIRIQNLNNPNASFNRCSKALPEKLRVRSGDLLFAWSGTPGTSFGAHIWKGCEAWLNQHIFRVEFDASLFEPEFLRLAINRNLQDYIRQAHGGAGLAHITKGKFEAATLIVPPLAEQRRMLVRLDALKARGRGARVALDAVPRLLAQARHSLLTAAFGGFLTADWRETNPATEPSLRLRKRLAEVRFTAWQKRRSLYQQDIDPKHYKPLTPPTEEFVFEIPDDWEVVSFDELTTLITSGSRDWTRHYRDNGSGTFIMAQNIRPLLLDFSSRQRVSPPDDRDRARSQVEEGDILTTIVGANTGDVCRVPAPLPEHYVCQSVALMRPVLPEMSRFLNYYMNSPRHGQWQFSEWMYGEGRPHLSFDHLREIAVVLPPLAEQSEIVRRLDAAFARLDAAAAAHAAAVVELDRLDASIIAKAFRGELVPQDPADEPAAVTLQRLRTPREVFDPVAYLFQFIPALLRASDGALPFARVLEGCALLRVPRDLVRLLEPIGGPPARLHFERFVQPLNDGSFVPVLRKLIAAGAITHDPRAGHKLRLVEAKAPPIAPIIAEDARHVASVLSLVPTEALEDLTPRHVRKLCPNPAAAALAF